MIPIVEQLKKKVAIHVTETEGKGTYPARRANIIAQALAETVDIIFISEKGAVDAPPEFRTITIDKKFPLIQALTKIKPDLLLRDSGSTLREDVDQIKEVVPSIIHFDDFGEGGLSADLVFQTLYTDSNEQTPDHYVIGTTSFIADEQFSAFKHAGLEKKPTRPLPHLVISFGDQDAGNLTYRALRHMLQLQIPLKVTVIVGEHYNHDISELRMMALGRRNTVIQEKPENIAEILATADVVLCASGYMPYEIAVIGIPCIVLAQNDFEIALSFPQEQHGFIHLGAGRKVKQSSLLNAVMEPLLHEPLRKKAIERQVALNLGDGKEAVCEAILYFLEYPKRPVRGETGKEEIDVI